MTFKVSAAEVERIEQQALLGGFKRGAVQRIFDTNQQDGEHGEDAELAEVMAAVSARAGTGEARVERLDRRNMCFKIRYSDKQLFAKQSRAPWSQATVATEAHVLETLAAGAMPGLDRFVPSFVGFDRGRHVVVSELIEPSTTLLKYHVNLGEARFPVPLAQMAATGLVRLHGIEPAALAPLPSSPPYGWDVGQLNQWLPGATTPARLAFMARMTASCPLESQLQAAIDRWQAGRCVVHADLRWSNILVAPEPEARVVFVDWELTSFGDPAWDVACYLGQYMHAWVGSVWTTAGTIAEAEALAPFNWSDFHASAQAFWSTYAQEAGLDENEQAELLSAVAVLLPLWLRQLAFESVLVLQALADASSEGTIPSPTRLMLELVGRCAANPSGALSDWFGIAVDG